MKPWNWQSALRVIALLPLILTSFAACTKTKIVTEYETVEVPVERYIPIPKELTRRDDPVQLPPEAEAMLMPGRDVLFMLREKFKEARGQLGQCFRQLERIEHKGRE